MSWILVGISIVGTLLNAQKKRSGFIWWSVANVGLIAYNVSIQQPALAAMFSVYLILAIYGWIQWGKIAK